MSYLREHGTRATPQSQPIPGSSQVPNSAGGHAWAVDKWTRLRRFLILGSEGGSYYATERDLTTENVAAIHECVAEDGRRTVDEIVSVSHGGLAPKNDPAIFALAVAASAQDEATRRYALGQLGGVCRTGTHLFQFVDFVGRHRGWGRALRRAVGRWYSEMSLGSLAYQAVKYRQREGWTHADLLRKAHPTGASPERAALFQWIIDDVLDRKPGVGAVEGAAYAEPGDVVLPAIVQGHLKARAAATPSETAKLIRQYRLPREAVRTDHLTDPAVWEALLEEMPMTAMIRNLGNMTRAGVVAPMSDGTKRVVEQLADEGRIRRSRVHPLAILTALAIYRTGHGMRSEQTWEPVAAVVDALDGAFYTAFGNVEPTGKRWLLALDISGSMDGGRIAGSPLTPREASSAMALVTAAAEPQHEIVGFYAGEGGWASGTNRFGRLWGPHVDVTPDGLTPLPISPRQRLDDVVNYTARLPMGGTDCALPMQYALAQGREVDVFVVYTDSETWAGGIHPAQALANYRRRTGINAKLIVVGMVSNGFSIADPKDPGMLDVVGFDTSVPQAMSSFAIA